MSGGDTVFDTENILKFWARDFGSLLAPPISQLRNGNQNETHGIYRDPLYEEARGHLEGQKEETTQH